MFFLNTAEQLASSLGQEISEAILIEAAKPYLGTSNDNRLYQMFEGAHSVILAVLSVPWNTDLLSRDLRWYIEVLLTVFPRSLSARQFRFAIKTLIKITSPPAPISEVQPLLPLVILDLVLQRLEFASEQPASLLDRESTGSTDTGFPLDLQRKLSERSVLVLTMIDSLPYLPLHQLGEILPMVAPSINAVKDFDQAELCRQRYWDVLSNGEMDIARSNLCINWLGTQNGENLSSRQRSMDEPVKVINNIAQEDSRL